MKKTKYVLSGGLAFAEEKDMEKLRKFSLKGWHVRDFKFMGYMLEQDKGEDYIYSLDYRSLQEDEKEEYYDFFSSAGWTHVASEADNHLFRALPGTKPIYSDKDTSVEKYHYLNQTVLKVTVPLLLITAIAWIGAWLSGGVLKNIFHYAGVFLTILALPMAWTLLTTYSNKVRVQGKRKLANLIKTIPILFLVISVVTLFFSYNPDKAVKTLVYMIMGAIIFPTALWIIMSLVQKFGGRES